MDRPCRFSENLEKNAEQMSEAYRIDEKSDFQLQMFESFILDCKMKSEKVLVLIGQLNPLVAERFSPKIREHMISFLRRFRENHPNVVIFENLPLHSQSNYEDLTHVKKETQERFTTLIADVLKKKPHRSS